MRKFLTVFGRRFEVLASFPADKVQEANDFMIQHPGTGLLAEVDGVAYIAALSDKGQPVAPMKCRECGRDAGQHVQHGARTPGYSICEKCAPLSLASLGIDRMAEKYGTRGLNYDMPDADMPPVGLPPVTGVLINGEQHLTYAMNDGGRAFLLEPDGTTVCEIVAPLHMSRERIARDIVHAQLSAVGLLAAAETAISMIEANQAGAALAGLQLAVRHARGEK